MRIRNYLKRKHIKMLLWWRSRTKKELEFDNEHQKKAYHFVEKMLRTSKSRLVFTPTSNSFYIENPSEGIYIIIHRKFISITAESTYITLIDDRMYESLQYKYYERLGKDKKAFKDRMYAKQKEILDSILTDDQKDKS